MMEVRPMKKLTSLEGQVSLWDIEFTQKPKEITKTEEKVTENEDFIRISLKEITTIENEKTEKPLELTVKQQEFLDKNKIYENENLSRVISYCSGGLGIELQEGSEFKTLYVNTEGKEEFTKNKKLPILPMDNIIYYKNELKANEIQEKKLLSLKQENNYLKEIRRKGDENIIAELPGRTISINSIGWVLEFQEVKAIYSEDEVIQNEKIDIKDIQSKVKVGDIIESTYSGKIIVGRVIRVYGPCNETLNIIFDNEKRHTAIPRLLVNKILKCA